MRQHFLIALFLIAGGAGRPLAAQETFWDCPNAFWVTLIAGAPNLQCDGRPVHVRSVECRGQPSQARLARQFAKKDGFIKFEKKGPKHRQYVSVVDA